ncbi:hypothetical protein ACET3Z_011681 [Daucus carota]
MLRFDEVELNGVIRGGSLLDEGVSCLDWRGDRGSNIKHGAWSRTVNQSGSFKLPVKTPGVYRKALQFLVDKRTIFGWQKKGQNMKEPTCLDEFGNIQLCSSRICGYRIPAKVNAYLYTIKYTSAIVNAGDAQARDKLERVLQCLDKGRCDALQDCITWTRAFKLHTISASTYLLHLSPHYASLSSPGQVNKHPTSAFFTSPSARSL